MEQNITTPVVADDDSIDLERELAIADADLAAGGHPPVPAELRTVAAVLSARRELAEIETAPPAPEAA